MMRRARVPRGLLSIAYGARMIEWENDEELRSLETG
jgi:hypothetical protein